MRLDKTTYIGSIKIQKNKRTMSNKTQCKEVELPFFFGFYNSPLEPDGLFDEEIEYLIGYNKEENGVETIYNDYDFDTSKYQKRIVEIFTEALKDYLPKWVESIENPTLWSPKFYNFQTDKIYCTLTLSENWKNCVMDFFEKNAEWLKYRIKKDWTSVSGWHSFISNDLEDFKAHTMAEEPQYISIILQYAIMLNEGVDDTDMFDVMTDKTMDYFSSNDSFSNYIELRPKTISIDSGFDSKLSQEKK